MTLWHLFYGTEKVRLTPRGLLVGGDVGVGVKAAGGKLGLPSSPSPASGAVEWVAL